MVHRIERLLWYVFLFTIPWQTRAILWQADTTFSEWRAMALWGTDLLMVGLFVLGAVGGWRIRRPDRVDWLLLPLVAAGAVSLLRAPAPEIGLYHLARLVQYALFFLYLRHWAWRRFPADASVLAFVLGAFLQAGIAWGQSIVQHDLGLRWLGETLLTPFMRGVAVFYDAPLHKVLRVYGTLPHPNVLAILLSLALWGFGWLWLRHGYAGAVRWAHAPWAIVGALLVWASGLTYARTVAAVWVLGSAVMVGAVYASRAMHWRNIVLIRARLRTALILLTIVGGLFVAMHAPQVVARMSIQSGDEAVRLRLDFARDALGSGGGASWLARVNWIGVGIGNFTTWLAAYDPSIPDYLRQPAHSVYLMAYAETGVLGTLALIMFVVVVVQRAWYAHRDQPLLRIGILAVLAAVLLAATWDHFFWTLQQGRIMWWMVLALAAGAVGPYNQSHER